MYHQSMVVASSETVVIVHHREVAMRSISNKSENADINLWQAFLPEFRWVGYLTANDISCFPTHRPIPKITPMKLSFPLVQQPCNSESSPTRNPCLCLLDISSSFESIDHECFSYAFPLNFEYCPIPIYTGTKSLASICNTI